MRIKEEIKRSGAFWLPSTPERDIYGTLSISDGGLVKLELTQPIDTDLKAVLGQTNDLKQIVGHVEKDGPVLIDRCYRIKKKRNIVHGGLIASDVIWADRVFTSLPYDENPTLRFNTFTFSIEGIDEWVGISGIDVNLQLEKDALTISYKRPTNVTINLENGMQLLITFAYTPPGFPHHMKAAVTQKTLFELISQDSYELDEFTSIANKITVFLCFIMNEIVCLDEMTAKFESLNHQTEDETVEHTTVGVYCPTRPYVKNEPEINPLDMLFTFTKVQDQFEDFINKWIDNYDQISPALDLFIMTKTGTLPSWNMQFLTLVQGLEAFHQRTSNKMTLRKRLEQLTDPFEKYMFGQKRPKMINKIVKTRHYLTHYEEKLEQEAAKGEELEFLCRKMNALFRLHFLKLIGFSEQEIDDIVDKCSYFKGECNL